MSHMRANRVRGGNRGQRRRARRMPGALRPERRKPRTTGRRPRETRRSAPTPPGHLNPGPAHSRWPTGPLISAYGATASTDRLGGPRNGNAAVTLSCGLTPWGGGLPVGHEGHTAGEDIVGHDPAVGVVGRPGAVVVQDVGSRVRARTAALIPTSGSRSVSTQSRPPGGGSRDRRVHELPCARRGCQPDCRVRWPATPFPTNVMVSEHARGRGLPAQVAWAYGVRCGRSRPGALMWRV
jgi:hypothetical protein